MNTISAIKKQSAEICAACGNGMPGFDAPKTGVNPESGRVSRKNTGQSPWSYHT